MIPENELLDLNLYRWIWRTMVCKCETGVQILRQLEAQTFVIKQFPLLLSDFCSLYVAELGSLFHTLSWNTASQFIQNMKHQLKVLVGIFLFIFC